MAGETNGTLTMEMTSHIPIAQLTPLLIAPATRSIKAVVTLTWPYSSATGSIAFLLSEPDFRLRRVRGQVRVQFAGSSAKAIAKAGIASGDEVILCLDGVEWLEDQTNISTPGRGVEFELKFTERLHLQFKQEDASGFSTVDIDYPAPEPETAPLFARIPTPEPSLPRPISNGTAVPTTAIIQAADEWSSPAFLKHARTSYGSLFDDHDPFSDTDGTVRGKGRKKTRLSSIWRYSSRSPTPEEEDSVMEHVAVEPPPKPLPTMMDEACQTVGLEVGVVAETLADFARQATNVGGMSYSQIHEYGLPEGAGVNGTSQDAEAVAMPPPRIQTQQADLEPDQAMAFDREAPSSPRLHPIPSDSLPLVSPLVSHAYGLNFDHPERQDGPVDNQLAVPNGITATDEEEEDIYGASPLSRRGESLRHGFEAFQQPPGGGQNTAFTPVTSPFAIEDQYGHWQNDNAQLSHSASPSGADGYYHGTPRRGQSYEADAQTHYSHGPSASRRSTSHDEQYPDIDPQLAGAVQYPELSDQRDDLDDEKTPSPPPPTRHSAMSRSQSVHSAVVDLTEDSDEEGEEDAPGEDEDSIEGSEIEEEYDEDESVQEYGAPVANQPFETRREHHVQPGYEADESDESDADAEGSQDMEDENVYYLNNEAEGDMEEDPRDRQALNPNNPERYDNDLEEEGSLEESDVGSYDDDEMEDAEAQPTPRGEPVFIDLLSSDDEGEPAVNLPQAHQATRSPNPQQESESDRENDESDNEDGQDDEDDVPYNERAEIRTTIIPRRQGDILMERYASGMYDEDGKSIDDREGSDDSEDSGPELVESEQEVIPAIDKSEDEISEEDEGSESAEEPIDAEDSGDVDLDDEPRTPPNKEASSVLHTLPKEPAGAASIEKNQRSSGRPGLFARMFSTDGGNDEPSPPRVSYPALPKESSPPARVRNGEDESQEPIELPVQPVNAQLPTPNTSQPFEKVIITESSVTSTTVQQTSQSNMSFSQEYHNITEVEVSTEIQMMDVDTQLSSNATDQLASEHLQPSPIAEELPETDDIAMTEEVTSSQDIVEVVVEISHSSKIEDFAERDDIQSNHLAQHDESMVSEQITDRQERPESDFDEEMHDDEAIPTGELFEADSDATDNEEASDVEEATDPSEPPKPTVTTRSASHALAESDEHTPEGETVSVVEVMESNELDQPALERSDVDKATDNTVETESMEQPKPTVTTRPAAHARAEETQSAEEPKPTVNTRAAARALTEEAESVEQPKPTVTTRAAAHALAEEADSTEVPKPMVTTRFAARSRAEETESVEEPKPTVTTRAAAHSRAEYSTEDPKSTVTTRSAAHSLTGAEKSSGVNQELDEPTRKENTQERDGAVAGDEPEFTVEHPRRSHRRVKSTTSSAHNEDSIRPVTPVKSHAAPGSEEDANSPASPLVVIDAHATPKGHDASIELALSSLESPSKQPHDLRKPPVADLKLRLSRALRTELSEFTALKVLRYHMNQKLDILAVATTTPPEPQRAKGGPRHYQITFNITDPSIAPSGVTEVQVFRPYSHALPTISVGDGILLRNFQVISVQKGFALRSTLDEGSSWAVFKDSEEPEIRGPPVEYGNGEKNHVIALKAWYATLDNTAKAKINRANGDKAAARR